MKTFKSAIYLLSPLLAVVLVLAGFAFFSSAISFVVQLAISVLG
jgi:hypothetical protein